MEKLNKKLIRTLLIAPCMLHNFIFLSFRFADWRYELNDDMHIRILAGAIGIFVSFLLYYGASYYLMLRYYKEKDRNTNIAIITLMVILVVLSFLFGYFVKNPYL